MIYISVLALALAPFVAAQSTDHALDIKAIEAHFTQSHVVPDLLSSFNPSALLSLNFAGVGDVTPGQPLTKEQVGTTPVVTVTPANSSVQLSGTYTLAMVDVDAVGADISKGVNRHWLVNGVTVSSSTVSNSSATAITPYAGPWPAAGSGPHRYVVLLYEQPSTFSAPEGFTQTGLPVAPMDFAAYVQSSGLTSLVAATYITVEEGTATASISATSAVVTSTLGQSSSHGSSTASGTSSSASATGSTPANNGSSRTLSSVAAMSLLGAAIITFIAA
ncbi:phosphatidylethanolamine-binding protein [Crucibulum laeve]|uniref:Phosphatidylethanolamine-binding protein n=1 Tax=Crucibulum laeve TaxID=68775 RepID=A0A5C3MG58_9AGAR|nr:phosphatidylethanolamine-binding protein [Crucibulum laeve]